MPKFKRKVEPFEATRWYSFGDHPAVIDVPEKYDDFIPVKNGATGYISESGIYDNSGIFVFPGDYIFRDICGDWQAMRSDLFESKFEEIE